MTKKQIEEKFKNVFNGEGKLEGKLHLEIDPNVKPIQLPVRKVLVAVKEKLKFELDRLSDLEIITPLEVRRHLRSSKEQFELNDPNVEMKDNDRQDDSCVRSNETSCENTELSLVQSSQDDLVELEKSQVT
jgi:hypothetical protein